MDSWKKRNECFVVQWIYFFDRVIIRGSGGWVLYAVISFLHNTRLLISTHPGQNWWPGGRTIFVERQAGKPTYLGRNRGTTPAKNYGMQICAILCKILYDVKFNVEETSSKPQKFLRKSHVCNFLQILHVMKLSNLSCFTQRENLYRKIANFFDFHFHIKFYFGKKPKNFTSVLKEICLLRNIREFLDFHTGLITRSESLLIKM